MQRLMHRLRIIHYLLAGLMLWEAAPAGAFARQEPQQQSIENIRVQINGRSSVYIDYDLIGPTEQVFRVQVTMKRESDSTFSYIPQNVAGDIGDNVFPGRNNRIVWSITKEFPEGIREGEFYFVFTVEGEQKDKESDSTPLLIAGGAALVGGIIALVMISKKEDKPPGTGANVFPQPPARPGP